MKHMKHGMLYVAALVFLALLFCLCGGALAEDWNGNQTFSASTEISDGVTVTQSLTLTVESGATLTVNGGMVISEGCTLTVDGAGALNVYGTDGAKGKKGRPGGDGDNGTAAVQGNLIVNAGTVTVNGGRGGDGGIGADANSSKTGGDGGSGGTGGTGVAGNLTINGGRVTVRGGEGGSGGAGGKGNGSWSIKGGNGGDGGTGGMGTVGNLTINGGKVTVRGGEGGSGGTGSDGSFSYDTSDGGNGGGSGTGIDGALSINGGTAMIRSGHPGYGGTGGKYGDTYGNKGGDGSGSTAVTGAVTIAEGKTAEDSEDGANWSAMTSGSVSGNPYINCPGSENHAITLPSGLTGGSVTARRNGETVTQAPENSGVTLFAVPESGYMLFSLTVDGEDVTSAVTAENTYAFIMPDRDVTVSAEFVETEAGWIPITRASDFGALTEGIYTLNAGNYRLYRDVVIGGSVIVPYETTVGIDLHGHTLSRGLSSPVEDGFVIGVAGNLTLSDSGDGGTVKGGNNSDYGGGVYIYRGSFTLNGGSVSGNSALGYGGGVYVYQGSFTMNGGNVSDNFCGNNSGDSYGGGVYLTDNAVFTLNSGNISGNNSKYYGGGVSIQESTFTMNGGSISGNSANEAGGGVDISTSTNTSTNTSTFVMNGGSISGNSGGNRGGGVRIFEGSVFAMNGGVISGNNASKRGGGVISGDSFSVSGSAKITGNLNGTYESNVDLYENKIIEISGPLSEDASIGVTMASAGVFTGGLSGKGTAENFFSDSSDRRMRVNDGGEAELYGPYSITFDTEMENGSVQASPAAAFYGETVTLTPVPAEGYKQAVYTVTRGEDPVPVRNGQFSMPDGDVTVSATFFTFDPADFEINSDSEYTIHSAAGWNVFCDLLDENEKGFFTGKTVKLGASISVTRMAGIRYHDFTGAFNGQGNTLNVSYGSATEPFSDDNAAPFRYVENGCVIENLHVTGDIYTSKKYAGGIVGTQYGAVTIRNCRSSVAIYSSTGGDGTHGGLAGLNGNSSAADLTIENCVFDGSLLGGDTHSCSGFVGYHSKNGTVTITNCLFAPTEVTISDSNSATFVRNGSAGDNCYYTAAFGETENQGEAMGTLLLPESVTASAAEGDTYTRGENIWYYPGKTVTLTVGPNPGFTLDSLTYTWTPAGEETATTAEIPAEDITQNEETGVYTASFEMPAGDVTVEAEFRMRGWTKLQTLLQTSGSYKLGEGELADYTDIVAQEDDTALEVPAGVTVTLDLNGHSLDRGLAGSRDVYDRVLIVKGNLTVTDSDTGGSITGGNNGGVYVDENGALTLSGGSITGNDANLGGGVYNDGTLTLNGGAISGNTADYGGGVCNNGTLTLNSGTMISGNTSYDAGGVYNVGTVDMNGVCNPGTIIMNGGAISDNTATGRDSIGGGVEIEQGTMTMNGGTISGNTAVNGGGVCVAGAGTFEMTGGEISGNTATYNYGGGVFLNGTLTLSGGSLSGNTSNNLGGGIFSWFGTLNLSGNPTVTGNVHGGTITNGTLSGGTADNLFIGDSHITVTGALTSDTPIGVSLRKWNGETFDRIPGVFTSGLSGKGDLSNFTSDSDDYAVRLDEAGEAKLTPWHSITVSAEHGTVTTTVNENTVTQAAEGDIVTLAVTPAEGYTIGTVSYNDGADYTITPVEGVYSFTMPDTDVTVTAVFCPVFGDPTFTMPAGLTTIEESAFEGDTEISVVDASNVATIGKWAFKDCTGLTQIKLSQHCSIDASAFSGCGTVYVFAPAGGTTENYCGQETNPCVFVKLEE